MHARARAEGVRVRARAVRRSGQGRRRTLRAGGRPTDRCVTLEPLTEIVCLGGKAAQPRAFFFPPRPKSSRIPLGGVVGHPRMLYRAGPRTPRLRHRRRRVSVPCRPSATLQPYVPTGRAGDIFGQIGRRGDNTPLRHGTEGRTSQLSYYHADPPLPPSPPSRKLLTAAITCQQSVHSCNGHVMESDSMTAGSLTFPLHARVM